MEFLLKIITVVAGIAKNETISGELKKFCKVYKMEAKLTPKIEYDETQCIYLRESIRSWKRRKMYSKKLGARGS